MRDPFLRSTPTKGPHQAADRNAFTHYTTISCKEICQTTAKQRSRTFVTESRAFALSRQRSRHTLRHSPAHRGAAAGARAGHVTLLLYGKKLQKSRKKSCEIACFSLFSVQKHLFFGCKGKKSCCSARLPMPAGTRRCTLCPQQFADTADCPAGNTANPPASRQKAGSKPPAPPQRAGQCRLSAGKGVSGRAAGAKKDFYKILTIS